MKSYEERKESALGKSPSMLAAFKRDDSPADATPIQYPRLPSRSEAAEFRENSNWRKFWDAPEGSLEEEHAARNAAIDYLIRTGAMLPGANPKHQQNVSDRFSEAASELYGEPDKDLAKKLASYELASLRSLIDNPQVDQELLKEQILFYESQLGEEQVAAEETDELGSVYLQFNQLLHRRFGQVFEQLKIEGKKPTDTVSPEETRQLFEKALDVLSQVDPAWSDWRIEIGRDSAMSVNRKKKVVYVGVLPHQLGGLPAKFTHEVLGHALRAVNGAKSGDKWLEVGMPGSLMAEEGVSTLLPASISGRGPSQQSKDFYMDIAFALGTFGQPKISREELQKISRNRQIVRSQARGIKIDRAEIDAAAWRYVNRIYRGSLGNDKIAVNTKDIVYYGGFEKISKFVIQKLKDGKTVDEIFDFITAGVFDPTNPRDVAYLKKVWEAKK